MAENVAEWRWLQTAIITCPQRAGVLSQTLISYSDADFSAKPHIFVDAQNLPNRQDSGTVNALRALTEMLKLPWAWLLFAEDDVEFNRHIQHNLYNWLEPQRGEVICGRLYSTDTGSGLVSNSYAIGGSQGILLERNLVKKIVRDWNTQGGGQDLRIFRIAGRVHVHQPNLVQHRSVQSTWGGRPHFSVTFDYDWRR